MECVEYMSTIIEANDLCKISIHQAKTCGKADLAWHRVTSGSFVLQVCKRCGGHGAGEFFSFILHPFLIGYWLQAPDLWARNSAGLCLAMFGQNIQGVSEMHCTRGVHALHYHSTRVAHVEKCSTWCTFIVVLM